MTGVTYDNFFAEVALYCKSQTKRSDTLGVVLTDPKSEVALRWIAYARAKGWAQRADTWRAMLSKGMKLTMPCEDPGRFDPDYRRPRDYHREAEFEAVPPLGEYERRQLSETLRAALESTKPRDKRKRKNNEEPTMTPGQILDALQDRNASHPVGLSQELRHKMGLDRQPAQDASQRAAQGDSDGAA